LPKPVIAEVHGVATAAGCQLVATCDLAVAAEDARFATPGVNIGLFCSTPMVALTRAVGRKAAMEMLLTGKLVDAATAQAIGLVNRVVPREGLRETVDCLAREIAGKSALTVAIGKEAFYRQAELPLAEAYDYAAKVMTRNMLARDAEEGIDAFLEKRPPSWRARRSISPSSASAGTVRLTRPSRHASAASTSSPVSSISIAALRPTARERATIGVEQKSPILTPGVANRAASEATARSQLATS